MISNDYVPIGHSVSFNINSLHFVTQINTNKKPSSNIVVTYVLYVNFRTKHYYIEKSNMNVIDVQTIYYLGILRPRSNPDYIILEVHLLAVVLLVHQPD